MTSAKEFVLAGGVIKALNEAGSWCGETHIQKSCSIAKSLKSVDFDSQFILYKHGPFSFDLNTTLSLMRAQNIVEITPRKIDSTYNINAGLWRALDRSAGHLFSNFENQIVSVCMALAKKNVAELERVATAVFVCLNFPKLDGAQRILQLRKLKPHIGENDARLAFAEASQI